MYSSEETKFKVWSPLSTSIVLNIYTNGNKISYKMLGTPKGVWKCNIKGDLQNIFYTYTVTNELGTFTIVDPYAKAVNADGTMGMVINLKATNPPNWENDKFDFPNPLDAIIYELHVRDISISDNSGIQNKGKFLAFTEDNTESPDNISTGLAHIKELGVTHIHFLPIFDFITEQYNWGYDPLNYNAPEGTYSTNVENGSTRIEELKKMIQSLHNNNIGVIMDVVYNHTAQTEDSYLNRVMPYYYYRCDKYGNFSNGSGCGNEIASERSMVRKFIVDSVTFWANEYHIDGFRFDLMGILDIETMNEIREQLNKINPQIIMYGEGWTCNDILLDKNRSAIKINTPKLNNFIASFSDDMRDAIKGHVFFNQKQGYINGDYGLSNSIKFGIVAATYHPQINYNNINYSTTYWANEPTQCINYAEAHDNLTLFDKLQLSCPNASEETLIAMDKMAATIVLTSQGIPFIHAGQEFLRTKVNPDGSLEHNSYNSPDSVNALDWNRKYKYKDVFEFYKGLICLRKSHSSFKMKTTQDIQNHLKFLELQNSNVIGYFIYDYKDDNWKKIGVFFNPTNDTISLDLPEQNWIIVVNQFKAGIDNLSEITNGNLVLPPLSQFVIIDRISYKNI
ncbi:MAG: type I pullulanase [Candidatus Epulonipiscium fishelsonii]|nr:MAG: type I pullulanase [Epulopiscium sp. AS2M-Bin002]